MPASDPTKDAVNSCSYAAFGSLQQMLRQVRHCAGRRRGCRARGGVDPRLRRRHVLLAPGHGAAGRARRLPRPRARPARFWVRGPPGDLLMLPSMCRLCLRLFLRFRISVNLGHVQREPHCQVLQLAGGSAKLPGSCAEFPSPSAPIRVAHGAAACACSHAQPVHAWQGLRLTSAFCRGQGPGMLWRGYAVLQRPGKGPQQCLHQQAGCMIPSAARAGSPRARP